MPQTLPLIPDKEDRPVPDEYLYTGTHPDQLQTGRQIAPFEKVRENEITEDEPLLEKLVKLPSKTAKKEAAK